MSSLPVSPWARVAGLAIWLVAPAVHAQAVDVVASTAEYVTARDCIAGATACDEISPVVFGAFGGLPGDVSSSASISPAGYGHADGYVALSGVVGAPVISASVSSQPGTRLNTNSVAFQRYVYEGSETTTRTFGGTVTYSLFMTGVYPAADTGLSVSLEIFTLAGSSIAIEPTAQANFDMLFGGYTAQPGYTSLGLDQYQTSTNTLDGLAEIAVSITLNPGDAVWVRALLQSPAAHGGWFDSSHTFVTGWDDATNLIPAAVVPEPATWALLLAGGAAVAAWARRRRS